MPSLLRTKIQLPPLRSGHVLRSRLQMTVGADREKLVLVSAPAGFGKSTALIQWAHVLQKADICTVWYALDERDNDPMRFATYLVEAFREQALFASSLIHEELFNIEDAIYRILNAVTVTDASVLLILDDYHLITEVAIHDAIGHMLDHMPPNLQLAIGTRADPPLQLARLRVRGEIAEIRMRDLRFSTPELRDWMSTALGWKPSDKILSELQGATEGWAAALSLILMHQQGTDETALTQQLARYSQSQRQLFDYFAQEILAHQSDAVRNFMLNTCVLDRLEPSICQTLTGQADAPLLLSELAVKSLFVIPLSDTEPIYRYHHLFVDFLRQYLQMQDNARYLDQQRRAARWFAYHEQVVDAVHHALMGEDYTQAASLITERAWEILTARGEIMTVIHWMERFPDEYLRRHPRLCLYFSRALYLTGDIERSQGYVQFAVDVLDEHGMQFDERDALRAIAMNYQATLAAYRGEVDKGLHWIDQAHSLRDAVDMLDKVRIANTNAFLHYLMGDVGVARESYERALALAETVQHPYLTLDAHYYLARIDLIAGHWDAVEKRCDGILTDDSHRIPPLSTLMLPLAEVRYARNQVVEAEALLRDAIMLARRGNIPDILWLAHISLAKVMLSQNEVEQAKNNILQAQAFAKGFHSPMMAGMIAASEAYLHLRTGQIDLANEWAERYSQMESARYQQDFENLTLARVWLAQSSYSQTLSFLQNLIGDMRAMGREASVLDAEILCAMAHQGIGNTTSALQSLEYVLIATRQQGIIRLLLDEGQPIRNLLKEAVKQGIVADYASYLLDIADTVQGVQHPADVLTEREIEVLGHIATGASNSDIAEALTLSIGTVKSHIHHIMSKLNAQNRTEAVSKARSLNILSN
jgi:LuxR family maltose regulon positive regulatory protein